MGLLHESGLRWHAWFHNVDIGRIEIANIKLARQTNPERWSRSTRNWTPIGQVVLNPEPMVRAV